MLLQDTFFSHERVMTDLFSFHDRFNEFDPTFFGIPEVEADFMDPQQKLLLQCSYRALEDAGISMESISGSRTGVYIGNTSRILCLESRASTQTHEEIFLLTRSALMLQV